MELKNKILAMQSFGMSQSEISAQIGRSQVWLYDHMRGRCKAMKVPDADAINKLYKRVIAARRRNHV